jgi:hypothetical protein
VFVPVRRSLQPAKWLPASNVPVGLSSDVMLTLWTGKDIRTALEDRRNSLECTPGFRQQPIGHAICAARALAP